jgi:hypothetical protein
MQESKGRRPLVEATREIRFDSNSERDWTIPSVLEEVRFAGAVVHQPDNVARYLASHPELYAVLVPAIQAARRTIGTEPQLSLELYLDPESSGQKLVLYVRSHSYTEDFFPKVMAAVDELRAGTGDHDDFLIATDFQPPK